MEFVPSTFPSYESQDQWQQWAQSTNAYCQHPPYKIRGFFSGNADQTSQSPWPQYHPSYDHGSSWTAQTPFTNTTSSPSSLSRTTSWPTFTSSAWTSPPASPECGLVQFGASAFTSLTPYAGAPITPVMPTSVSEMQQTIGYHNRGDGYNYVAPHQHTPRASEQAMTATDFQNPPSVSAASFPLMFSHQSAVSAADEHGRRSGHLTGLGLGPVQDLTYPAWIKEKAQGHTNDQQNASANNRRLEKRRKRKAPVASSKDSKPFRCDRCNFAFDRKCNLTCHMKTHGVGRGKVVCDEPGCGKAYGRRADVNRHKRTIHQGASFVCEDCGKEFGRSDILMRHDGACHAKKNGQYSMGGSPAGSDWTPTM